jgi:hypothetical protein
MCTFLARVFDGAGMARGGRAPGNQVVGNGAGTPLTRINSNQGATLMDLGTKILITLATRIVHAAGNGRAMLSRLFAEPGEARRRRAAHDQEFYRAFKSYCRANNLSPLWVDDWKPRGLRRN